MNHLEIEKKWQDYWYDNKLFKAVDFSSKPKYYCLIEFPYPSGAGMHIGHVRAYSSLEVISRKRRMAKLIINNLPNQCSIKKDTNSFWMLHLKFPISVAMR